MLENIRHIGMFMIIAQTVIHFAAGKKYEKYLKIIAGVIVLLLFVSPFVSSSGEIAARWQAEMEEMANRLERLEVSEQSGDPAGISFAADNVQKRAIRQIEEQIRNRLNELIQDTGCRVTGVEIALEEISGESEFRAAGDTRITGKNSGDWVFQRIRITVQGTEETKTDPLTDGGAVRKIEIEEVRIGGRTGTKQEPEAKGEIEPGPGTEAGLEIEPGTEAGLDTEPGRETGTEDRMAVQKYREIFARELGIAEDRVEVEYLGEW